MKRIGISCIAGLLCLTLQASAQEATPKPPYERMLKKEDARRVEVLQDKIYGLQAADKYAGAIQLGDELVELRTKLQGEDHYETVNAKYYVAGLRKIAALDGVKRRSWPSAMQSVVKARQLESKGRYAEALLLQQATLDIRREVLGEDHPDTAKSYNNLAFNLELQGKSAEAQPLFQKVLEIYRRVLGEDHPDTATSYNNIAYNLNAQGKAAEALPLFQRSLEITRRVLGENHPDTATGYNNVASGQEALGKVAEAQPLYQKALEINRRVLGENHPATAGSYNSVSTNLNAQGKAAEAQPLLELALEIRRKVLGENHPDTATSYNNLAANLDDLQRAADAQPFYRKALEIRRRAFGEDHPDTATSYDNLAYNLNALGKRLEAQAFVQNALDIRRRVLGEGHPDTATSYNNLATSLDALGKAAEAQVLHQKGLEINRRVLGEDHPDTALSYHNLATNLIIQGKLTEAETILGRAIFSYEASRLTRATGLDRAALGQSNPRLLLAVIQHEREPLLSWGEIELSLARGLLDQQASAKRSLTPEQEAEWIRSRSRIASVQPQILTLETTAKRSDDETARLESLLNERREAEQRLAELGVSASQREVSNSDTIQAALAEDAALLCWVDVASHSGALQEHWACVVRHQGDPKWERLPGTGPNKTWSKDDTALAAKLRAALAGSVSQGDVESLAKQLHAQRIQPIRQHLAGVKRVYVVPVNAMAGIPLEALTTEYTISYIHSGTFLARLKDRAKPMNKSLLALADPIFADMGTTPAGPASLPSGGLFITLVVSGGAADQAGLKTGDVLLKYGDTELADVDKLKEAIAANFLSKTIPVTIWRENAGKPFVRDLATGKLGIEVDKNPAPVAIANRRKTDAVLLGLRGGDWGDLPGTRVEVSRIEELFGANATVLADSSASEQKLESLRQASDLKNYRYLHFATHGEGNRARAFESALILAQDDLSSDPLPKAGEPFINGQLSASEVLEFWKLDAELVTLSACETAVGKQGGGDGALGFAQAFLTAGSRAVCLSLWKVDDTATTLLMDRFYQNLLGKRTGPNQPMGKAAALAEAKNWLRNLTTEEAMQLTADMTKGVVRGKGQKALPVIKVPNSDDPAAAKTLKPFDHPKYWAAFILIGDPD